MAVLETPYKIAHLFNEGENASIVDNAQVNVFDCLTSDADEILGRINGYQALSESYSASIEVCKDLHQRIADLESAWRAITLARKDRIIATQEEENDRVKQELAITQAQLKEQTDLISQLSEIRADWKGLAINDSSTLTRLVETINSQQKTA